MGKYLINIRYMWGCIMKAYHTFLIYKLLASVTFLLISTGNAKASDIIQPALAPTFTTLLQSNLINNEIDEEPELNLLDHVQEAGTHENNSKADITLAVIALPHVLEREAVALLHHWLRVWQQSSLTLI